MDLFFQIPLLVVAVVAVAAQDYADERGLLTALSKRRSALASRINGIMRRSYRKSEKSTDGKTLNLNRRGYYQYQLDDDSQVLDSYTYYDQPPSNPTGTETDALRDGNDFYGYAHEQSEHDQDQYTTGEYIQTEDTRRPFSGLLNRLTNLFGRRQVNIGDTRSAELTNLINEQIAIDDHIKYIQSTIQGRGRGNNEDDLSPLQLSRSRIGETIKPTGRQASGIFIPLSYLLSQENQNQISSTLKPSYETQRPGWVVKPIQQVFLPTNGLPTSTYSSSSPVYVKNLQTSPTIQGVINQEIIDVSRPDDESIVISLKTKLESIEDQIDFIKTHTDPTVGNRPHVLFDLEVQAHDLRNKIKRIEYTLEHKISHNFKK